jgi:NIMA (never in mitosis gene a)-related kinase
MVTLKHAFDANSMKALVIKILRGNYPPIPSCYSADLRGLLEDILQKDPARRPSIKKILEKEFLASRINTLLSDTVAKHEMSERSVPKPLASPADSRAASHSVHS